MILSVPAHYSAEFSLILWNSNHRQPKIKLSLRTHRKFHPIDHLLLIRPYFSRLRNQSFIFLANLTLVQNYGFTQFAFFWNMKRFVHIFAFLHLRCDLRLWAYGYRWCHFSARNREVFGKMMHRERCWGYQRISMLQLYFLSIQYLLLFVH